jgi:hypothetical protein
MALLLKTSRFKVPKVRESSILAKLARIYCI